MADRFDLVLIAGYFAVETVHVYLMHRNSDLRTSVKQCHMLPAGVISARHIVVAGCVTCPRSVSRRSAVLATDCAKLRGIAGNRGKSREISLDLSRDRASHRPRIMTNDSVRDMKLKGDRLCNRVGTIR